MSRPFHFGIVGYNIGYTLSPRIFAALFDILEVDGKFTVFDIASEDLSESIPKLRQLDGFSITIPHKNAFMPYLDSQAPEAINIGAVNSIKVADRKLVGHNTDWVGFVNSIRSYEYSGKKILILGCGGAARAVLYGLLSKYESAEIVVAGRNLTVVSDMIETVTSSNRSNCTVSKSALKEISGSGKYDLIINCTPLGSANFPDQNPVGDNFDFSSLPFCYDLIYNPVRTNFLQQAADAGCLTINGLPMLVYQALESYQIWSERQLVSSQLYPQVMEVLSKDQTG